jgi:hypothetical protein
MTRPDLPLMSINGRIDHKDKIEIIEDSNTGERSEQRAIDKEAIHDEHLALVDGQLANERKKYTYDEATRLKRKADRRLLPLLVFAYLVKNIDNNLASVRWSHSSTTLSDGLF